MRQSSRQLGRGLTLLEALVAALILSIAVTAVTMPFVASARNEQSDGRRTTAVGLAQEIMEEVLSKPFDDPQGSSQPGPEPGETDRAKFDNIDDYHGYSETAGHVANLDGAALDAPNAAKLSRNVSAAYVYLPGQDKGEPPTFLRVTVEIRYDDRPLVTLTRLIYSQMSAAPQGA